MELCYCSPLILNNKYMLLYSDDEVKQCFDNNIDFLKFIRSYTNKNLTLIEKACFVLPYILPKIKNLDDYGIMSYIVNHPIFLGNNFGLNMDWFIFFPSFKEKLLALIVKHCNKLLNMSHLHRFVEYPKIYNFTNEQRLIISNYWLNQLNKPINDIMNNLDIIYKWLCEFVLFYKIDTDYIKHFLFRFEKRRKNLYMQVKIFNLLMPYVKDDKLEKIYAKKLLRSL